MSVFKRLSGFVAVVALGAAMTLSVVDMADARQGGSFGSRGTRTFQSPSATQTAPSAAAPIQRSTTPYSQQGATSTAAASRGGLFGNGFGGSLMRGLLIGGLVGMLFGGGLGGLSGFLGLLLQAALLAGVVMLALRFFASRRQPAPAGAGYGQPMARQDMAGNGQGGMFGGPAGQSGGMGGALGGALGGLGGRGPTPADAAPRVKDELGIKPADFDAFEKTLVDVQAAFSREDRSALANLVTPEVLGYLEEELRANAERGLRNQVNDVKLLQGDLSEAWREGALEYATVAMRYEARDTMRDRTTGALAPGSSDAPRQSTEIWTFIRPRGAPWKLSAIQEA